MTKHALTSLCVSRYKDVDVTEEIKKLNIHTIITINYHVNKEKEWRVVKNLDLVKVVSILKKY